MSRRLLRAGVSLFLIGLIAGAAPAVAAPVSLAESTLFVQFYPEEQGTTASMVAYVQIPENASLPATVRIPIPEEGEPFWVGEVFGAVLNDTVDKERDYEIVDGDGGPVVEMTLEETRTAMYEAATGPLKEANGRYSVAWRWVQSEVFNDVQFSITFPPNATLVKIDPAPFGSGQVVAGGRKLFVFSPARLASGESTTFAVSYSQAQTTLPEVKAPGYDGPVPLWLIVGLTVALVALVGVLLRERNRRMAAAEALDEGDDDDDMELLDEEE